MGELINTFDNYSIYRVYNNIGVVYYLCVPNENISICQIFLGFSDKDLKELSNDDITYKIGVVMETILKNFKNSVYVIPDIPISLLEQAAVENDDRMYLDILNNMIHPVILDVHNILVNKKIDSKNINQIIGVIEQNDTDTKLGGWLAMKLSDNYIRETTVKGLDGNFIKKEDRHKLISDEERQKLIDDKVNIIPIQIFRGVSNRIMEVKNIRNSGIAPINLEYENKQIQSYEKKHTLVRESSKSKQISAGFSSIKFIVAVLLFSLVIGVFIGYLIMK